MRNKKILILALCFALVIIVFGFFGQNSAKATGCDATSTTLCIPSGAQTGLPDPADPQNGVEGVLRNLLIWLLSIMGVIGIIGFIISGFQYLTSYGDENKIESAKKTMTYSVVGIAVAISGWVIVGTIHYLLSGVWAI